MSPNSRFHRRPDDNMLMVGDFEFTDEFITPYIDPVPHVREWVWAFVEDHAPQFLLYGFDGSEGPLLAPGVVAEACQAYLYDLTEGERMALHEKKLVSLSKALCEKTKHVEWAGMIGSSLLASLCELTGAPREEKIVFENAIRDVITAADAKHFQIACELDEEQEWEPIVDVVETDE